MMTSQSHGLASALAPGAVLGTLVWRAGLATDASDATAHRLYGY
jgi:hypothetical protein